MLKIILLLSCFLVLSGCSSKDEEIYSQPELWSIATKADKNIEIILPNSIAEGIVCDRDYRGFEGCLSGRFVKLRKVKAIILEFQNSDQAKRAAYHLDQYYAKNWVFDEVRDEPVLESFVKSTFNAKRPKVDEPDYVPIAK
jgi:hypothetical protein